LSNYLSIYMRRSIGMLRLKILASAVMMGTCVSAFSLPLAPELVSVLQEHPMIKSARSTLLSAEDNLDVAKAGWYPRLSLSADNGREKISSATSTEQTRRRTAVTLEQNVFSGLRTMTTNEIANVDLNLQKNNLNSVTQNVLYEALYAYIQVARYKSLVAIASRNEETTQKQFRLEDERVQRGGGIAVDVLQAKTRLQIAKEKRVGHEQQLRDAMANYVQVFGHEPDLATLQNVGVLDGLLPKNLDDALALAAEHNPVLLDSILSSEKARKQVVLEQSNYYPSFDLVGVSVEEDNANQVRKRSESSLLLKMNWVLFSGGETPARSSSAANNAESLVSRELATKRKITEQIKQAWNQRMNGLEREDLLANAVNISYEVMQSRKRLRDVGKENALNVLDAEVEYFNVLSNRLNAAYDAKLAAYKLLLAMGRLNPQVLGLEEGSGANIRIPVSFLKTKVDGV
jgi:adhesin transport system outer membrane protein